MTKFCRHQLRTTDVAGARAFYASVLGSGAAVDAVPLPPEVAARGAPPHWLGHLGVGDVERTADAFVARGALRLGPTRPAPGGGQTAILRDPGGAVVALTTSTDARTNAVWYVLHTSDLARASASYVEICGWQLTERIDLGPLGEYQQFAWTPGGPNAGAITDITKRPGVHPHWLIHFPVPAIAAAIAAVSASGGELITQLATPDGAQIAVCHDPQGAIFALRA